MKKPLLALIFIFALKTAGYSQLSFTITNLTGGYSITCATPSIHLLAWYPASASA